MRTTSEVLRAAAAGAASPAWDTVRGQTTRDPDIMPGLSSPLAERPHAQARAAGRDAVAANLTRLFGWLACAGCGTPFTIAGNLASVSRA